MKSTILAAASSLALCLSLASLPGKAQQKSSTNQQLKPEVQNGMWTGGQSRPAVLGGMPTVLIIKEVIKQDGAEKGSTALTRVIYRVEPIGLYYDIVRVCLPYAGNSWAEPLYQEFNLALATLIKDRTLLDSSGKPLEFADANGPYNDSAEGRVCRVLKTTRR